MTMRTVGIHAGGAGKKHRQSTGGWRSHTFSDGVRSLTLNDRLDAQTAARLWARLAELMERGCRHLVVDASAVEPLVDEPALLAAAFAGWPASCQAVVIAPAGSTVAAELPPCVGVAGTLTEARRQLKAGIVSRENRKRQGPAKGLSAGERHELAVRQSLRWAERSAHEGDYEQALSWLATVEAVEGQLPDVWHERRRAWLTAQRAQAASRKGHDPGRS